MIPDVKKLITGFLIVAAAASSSALIISNTKPGGSVAAFDGNLAGATAPLTEGQNAFVPSQNDILNAAADTNPQVAAALNNPQNLTTNYTEAFLNGVVVANPNGITTSTDSTGDIVTLNRPAVQVVAKSFAQSPAVKGLQLPNWDAEVAAQKLNITDSANSGAYSDALNSSLEKNIIQGGVQSLVGQQGLDPSNFGAITPALKSVTQDIAQTPTPKNLASFQKSLVAALVYQRNMANLADLAQTDPVKASLIYQAESTKYDLVIQAFGVESEKASAKGLFSFRGGEQKSSRTIALLETYFGIPTAHAQWPTWDMPTFARWIKDEIESIIIQLLRNSLTAFIQQRVLKWIQGSGAPMFVQQFGNQIVNVAQAKAMSAVASILPGYKYTCPNIGNLLGPTIANLGLTTPTGKQPPVCNLTVSGANLKNFYNNFNFSGINSVPGGNWGLYAQVLSPNNNYYGALMQSQDYVNQQSSDAAQTAQTKQIVNQGFSPQTVCDDGSDPNATSSVCDDKSTPSNEWICDNGTTAQPAQVCLDGISTVIESCPSSQQLTQYVCLPSGNRAVRQMTCNDGTPAYDQSNFGLCKNGDEPRTVTPGQTTKGVQLEALGGGLKLVTNANNIVGMLEAVGMSLINTVVQTGINAAVKAGTGGLLAVTLPGQSGGASMVGGATPIQAGTPIGGPALPPTTCAPRNPICTTGPGGQCNTSFQGQVLDFSATGGDGLNFTWVVGIGKDAAGNDAAVTATPASANASPIFSPYFTVTGAIINPVTGLSSVAFPVTIPVTVTGSDGKSDTCLAVLGQ
jgi:hypothetical protein